jgi:prevent-host-death family protein
MVKPDQTRFSAIIVMKMINIQAAKTHLSRLVEDVVNGEEIILGKAGKPLVRLVPYTLSKSDRVGGQFRGQIWEAEDCWSDDGGLLDESISGELFNHIPEPALVAEAPARA